MKQIFARNYTPNGPVLEERAVVAYSGFYVVQRGYLHEVIAAFCDLLGIILVGSE